MIILDVRSCREFDSELWTARATISTYPAAPRNPLAVFEVWNFLRGENVGSTT